MPSLQSLTFDTSELQIHGEEPNRKVWFTEDGDGVSLNFFDKKPDIPPNLHSLQEVRDFYLSMLQGTPTKLVDLSITNIGGCPAIRMILKSPQKPHGMTYLGSITVPFRDCSFVVKCQCMERGTTGIREAILNQMAFKAGTMSLDAHGKITGGPDYDAAEHDAKFPQHPLSKLRRLLALIETTSVIDSATRNEPGFPLPS
jgi:hypothetical protein